MLSPKSLGTLPSALLETHNETAAAKRAGAAQTRTEEQIGMGWCSEFEVIGTWIPGVG
jgi:hypothetical protein